MNKLRIFLYYSGLVDMKATEQGMLSRVYPWSFFFTANTGSR